MQKWIVHHFALCHDCASSCGTRQAEKWAKAHAKKNPSKEVDHSKRDGPAMKSTAARRSDRRWRTSLQLEPSEVGILSYMLKRETERIEMLVSLGASAESKELLANMLSLRAKLEAAWLKRGVRIPGS